MSVKISDYGVSCRECGLGLKVGDQGVGTRKLGGRAELIKQSNKKDPLNARLSEQCKEHHKHTKRLLIVDIYIYIYIYMHIYIYIYIYIYVFMVTLAL